MALPERFEDMSVFYSGMKTADFFGLFEAAGIEHDLALKAFYRLREERVLGVNPDWSIQVNVPDIDSIMVERIRGERSMVEVFYAFKREDRYIRERSESLNKIAGLFKFDIDVKKHGIDPELAAAVKGEL